MPAPPQVLYEGFTCTDPIDCRQKCIYLQKTSIDGRGAPPTCALCDQLSCHPGPSLLCLRVLTPLFLLSRYCPSNIVSTIMQLVDAVYLDTLTIARIVAVCIGNFGPAGCVCQLALTLQPSWREYRSAAAGPRPRPSHFLLVL